MKFHLLFPTACALAAAAFGQPGFPDFLAEGKWPVPEGAKVTLEVDRQQWLLGENVLVHFVLENVGTEPFQFSYGGDYRGVGRALRFKVTATDEFGKAVDPTDPPALYMGGLGGDVTLKPGEKWTRSLPIMRYCRFEQASKYTIRVTHDLGWNDGVRKHPFGEVMIELKMPSEAEAAQVIAGMEKAPDHPNNSSGQRSESYGDWGCLCAAIYLKPLAVRLEQGNLRALEGLAKMETLDASRTLIELASRLPVKSAAAIAAHLPNRMPLTTEEEERYARGGQEFLIPRKRMAQKSWRPELNADVRSLARSLLPRDSSLIAPAARLLVHVGASEDADVISGALMKVLEADFRPRRSAEDTLEWPEALSALASAANALRTRGWVLPDTLNGNAEILLYLWQLADTRIPRSSRSAEILEAFFVTSHWQMREAAVVALPPKLDDRWVAKLSKALDDEDYGVVRAACRRAGKSARTEFAERLVNIVAAENNRALVREASEAAEALGATKQLLDVWADRLADSSLWGDALDFLQQHSIAWTQGHSGRTDLTREERIELRKHWRDFLQKHRDVLATGKRFEFGDAAVVPGMFGRARQFTLRDGSVWPPRKE